MLGARLRAIDCLRRVGVSRMVECSSPPQGAGGLPEHRQQDHSQRASPQTHSLLAGERPAAGPADQPAPAPSSEADWDEHLKQMKPADLRRLQAEQCQMVAARRDGIAAADRLTGAEAYS